MSDGISDSYRDQERGDRFEDYIIAVIDYLVKPTKASKDTVLDCAERCDGVGRGYFTGPTSLRKNCEELLEQLVAQDHQAWARMLMRAEDCSSWIGWQKYQMSLRDKLKSISPFKDKMVGRIEYGIGFSSLYGDIKTMFDQFLSANDYCVNDCDTYTVIMDKPVISQVVWHNSRAYSKSGEYQTPKKSERKKIRDKAS